MLATTEKKTLYPPNDFSCEAQGFGVFFLSDRGCNARVAREYRASGELFCLFDGWGDLLASLFQYGQQLSNIVYIRKLDLTLNQQCFDGFFRSLLNVET